MIRYGKSNYYFHIAFGLHLDCQYLQWLSLSPSIRYHWKRTKQILSIDISNLMFTEKNSWMMIFQVIYPYTQDFSEYLKLLFLSLLCLLTAILTSFFLWLILGKLTEIISAMTWDKTEIKQFLAIFVIRFWFPLKFMFKSILSIFINYGLLFKLMFCKKMSCFDICYDFCYDFCWVFCNSDFTILIVKIHTSTYAFKLEL